MSRPDKTEFVLMRTLMGKTALVEKKYMRAKQPVYTIMAMYPSYSDAAYALASIQRCK